MQQQQQQLTPGRENGGWSEQPWAGVRAIEDAVGDGVVAGLRQVDAVPVGVRRRVRAHAGAPHAAARLRVEVVRPSAAAARPQRPVPEPCRDTETDSAATHTAQLQFIGELTHRFTVSERGKNSVNSEWKLLNLEQVLLNLNIYFAKFRHIRNFRMHW